MHSADERSRDKERNEAKGHGITIKDEPDIFKSWNKMFHTIAQPSLSSSLNCSREINMFYLLILSLHFSFLFLSFSLTLSLSLLFAIARSTNSKISLSGTSSWKEQFTEALTVSGGDENDAEGGSGQSSSPSPMDYLMHSVTIFWKVLFAFVPPTGE